MTDRLVESPTSLCRAGIGRVDITPPVGIYHRFWGAARHDRATGVHQPLVAGVLLLEPLSGDGSAGRHAIVALDHCLLRPPDMDDLQQRLSTRTGLPPEQLTVTFSHTHAAGHIVRSRSNQPGGELIGPYLDELPERIAAAYEQASASLAPAVLTYDRMPCNMGRHRDYFDSERETWVCGFNPDAEMELPVSVVRIAAEQGGLLATVVSYPCHPTTLAWDNTLISPDYVGTLRHTVEKATGAPCLFLLAPCGEVGPRYGFVGDVAVAEQAGRQVGHAALAALESMLPPERDFRYAGPVVSGATIGVWEPVPLSPSRRERAARFRHERFTVSLARRDDLADAEATQREMRERLDEERAARDRGDENAAAEARALAERCRRTLERVGPLPSGESYPYTVDLWQIGDAFWLAVEGEPYYELQRALQERLAGRPLIAMTLAGGAGAGYLPREEDYARLSLYQQSVAVLAPGSLERLTRELTERIDAWDTARH